MMLMPRHYDAAALMLRRFFRCCRHFMPLIAGCISLITLIFIIDYFVTLIDYCYIISLFAAAIYDYAAISFSYAAIFFFAATPISFYFATLIFFFFDSFAIRFLMPPLYAA